MVNLARSGRAFEVGGRNQNSDKYILPRIEFCVECIFRIFEYSFFEKYILNPYSFAGDPARAAAIWGRVGPCDATASARATRNPAYAGPGFGAAPSACLAPPRRAGGALCGHDDHLGQAQSPHRRRDQFLKNPF